MGMIKTQRDYERSRETFEQWRGSGERLGVNEAQVSKDESNEYHGISVERAQRIIDALEGSVTVAVSSEQPDEPTWEPIRAR
jgi:hypothetical protein